MHGSKGGEADSRQWIIIDEVEKSCTDTTSTILEDLPRERRTGLPLIDLRLWVCQLTFYRIYRTCCSIEFGR